MLVDIIQIYTCVQALVLGLLAASAACAVFASQREAYSPLFPKRVFLQHRHELGRDGRIQVSKGLGTLKPKYRSHGTLQSDLNCNGSPQSEMIWSQTVPWLCKVPSDTPTLHVKHTD